MGNTLSITQGSNRLLVVSSPGQSLSISQGANRVIQISPVGSSLIQNTSSASDPDENYDESQGYKRFSQHINTDTKTIFVCFDPAEGAADWQEIPLW